MVKEIGRKFNEKTGQIGKIGKIGKIGLHQHRHNVTEPHKGNFAKLSIGQP